MSDSSLGTWLRRERERRGVSLKSIADQTKVAAPLLEGLEAGDLARWPGGIYRRAFVRAYATAVGLDADEVVKRFEQEHGPSTKAAEPAPGIAAPGLPQEQPQTEPPRLALADEGRRLSLKIAPQRSRVIGTVADLTVALVLGLGSAAAGSRLLWPVLLIAAYYSLGILLTGTSPMVALLTDQPVPSPKGERQTPADPASQAQRTAMQRGHQLRRPGVRQVRSTRNPRARLQ